MHNNNNIYFEEEFIAYNNNVHVEIKPSESNSTDLILTITGARGHVQCLKASNLIHCRVYNLSHVITIPFRDLYEDCFVPFHKIYPTRSNPHQLRWLPRSTEMAASIPINDSSSALQSFTLTGVKPLNEAELGRGAYGKVFKVEHKGILYAAKEIHKLLIEISNAEEKEKMRNDFLRECYNCSKLYHPNIVKFAGIYYTKENLLFPVMVMELMGESLTKYVKQPEIYVRKKISILHNVASGVSYLHNYIPPIIHRDLSPNNILMSHGPNPVAKISDLGVAKVVKADSKATKSILTKVPGTVDFMPPECLVDNPIYDTSLDIFSYAGIVLHVVNQEWPEPTAQFIFNKATGELTTVNEIQRRQDHINKMKDVSGVNMQILQDLVEKCLQKIASKRPGITYVLKVLEQVSVAIHVLTWVEY